MLVFTKLGRVVTCYEGLHPQSHINLLTCDHVKSCDKSKTSTLAECLWSPDFVRVVKYLKELPSINSHDFSMR